MQYKDALNHDAFVDLIINLVILFGADLSFFVPGVICKMPNWEGIKGYWRKE